MSRLRFFLKFILYAVLAWILLAVTYLVLPSPTPSIETSISTLLSGRTITWIYRIENSYPYTDRLDSVQHARQTSRRYFTMYYTLRQTASTSDKSSNYTLTLGAAHNIPLNTGLDDADRNTLSPALVLPCRAADTDGITPPYFATPDAALLNWWVHRDVGSFPLRVRRVPLEKLVELWPESSGWNSSPSTGSITPPNLKPFIAVQFNASDITMPPKITFPASDDIPSSLSATYTFRLALLAILAPTGFVAVALVGFVASVIYGVFHFFGALLKVVGLLIGGFFTVLFIWWLVIGRPRLPITEAVKTIVDAAVEYSRNPTSQRNPVSSSESREESGEQATPLIDLEAQRATDDVHITR